MADRLSFFLSSKEAARAVGALRGRADAFFWDPEGILSVKPKQGEEQRVKWILSHDGNNENQGNIE